MQIMRMLHEMTMRKIADVRKQMEQNPELSKEIEYNVREYGVPIISGSYGARWREDLPKDVRNLLFEDLPYQLVEIRIRPEDPDGHHWTVEYDLLAWDEREGFVKAVDYERGRKGGEESGGNKGTN